MVHLAAENRYDSMQYQRCGRSGVLLPKVSLGLWHNFGDTHPLETQRAVLRRAFDLGVTHIDLANNYGPPPGSAETNFGSIFAQDFRPYRDELFIASKAGYLMWPGPYGEWGSRKYVLASLDQSLSRMGLDYVDVFYSHRFDPDTPLEETMGALDTAVRQGKALYAGLSNYPPEAIAEAAAILKDLRTPYLINQHPYSILQRGVEGGVLQASAEAGAGVIAFSPLAQGQLTDRYLHGVPADSRMALGHFLKRETLTEERLALLHALNKLAEGRGQTLAQLALAWVLRDPRVVSVLIGASSVAQLEQNVAVLDSPDFSDAELAEIDRLSAEAGIEIP
ncbi:aldo/keto reductase [Streptomyces rapamycinicus]|uniref:L-glyceraldehyde 3-phosphate reductase n=2 Tax=Streptomyces rapamycinicus TaxID=1226757 RepID=A0A0A0N8S0_STRRN|nr:aldo/keto reductase [Streptomyces rapamycinicus]AGP52423.1 L-glyceraldehyde 3-phosphate reductase [Streptomyces rapamycinicus NRRL 5491]MBB4779891.1 L-glyceraldehyde 3-phosphate reductase [Streptomyces rapamycinicus]RLV75454.1 L-glyceraldehyde 3-phosphate reductase [Streptomyces rapamycinicus NRRL 5491]UTP28603.1 aldo/keto reductase [Streptomyces rapamycinicus NRRL 5491]